MSKNISKKNAKSISKRITIEIPKENDEEDAKEIPKGMDEPGEQFSKYYLRNLQSNCRGTSQE